MIIVDVNLCHELDELAIHVLRSKPKMTPLRLRSRGREGRPRQLSKRLRVLFSRRLSRIRVRSTACCNAAHPSADNSSVSLFFFQIVDMPDMPYHMISYYILSYHTISYHNIPHHISSYHIMSCNVISYHIKSYHIMSYHTYHKYIVL